MQVLRGNKANSSHGRQKMLPTPTASNGGPDDEKATATGMNLPGAVRSRLRLLTPIAKGNTASPSMKKWSGGANMQAVLLQIEQAGG